MVYQDFIKCVEQQDNKRIRALGVEESCSTGQIPNQILGLLPNLIETLAGSQHFCHRGQVMVLFGLQPCVMAFYSNFPVTFKRMFDVENPFRHFCCVLQYFITSGKSFPQKSDWQKTQTLIVDFTTGLLMDNQFYFSKVFALPSQGLTYGTLNQDKLNDVWTMMGQNGLKFTSNHG